MSNTFLFSTSWETTGDTGLNSWEAAAFIKRHSVAVITLTTYTNLPTFLPSASPISLSLLLSHRLVYYNKESSFAWKKGCRQQDKRLLKTWITASQLYVSVHQYAAVPELWRWIIGTTSEKYDVAGHSTPDLLDIKHHNVLLDICVKCLPNYRMNSWVMAQNVFCEVTVTLTCDIRPPNSVQISSSLSYSWHLDQIWRNSLNAFLKYLVHEIGTDGQLEHKIPPVSSPLHQSICDAMTPLTSSLQCFSSNF